VPVCESRDLRERWESLLGSLRVRQLGVARKHAVAEPIGVTATPARGSLIYGRRVFGRDWEPATATIVTAKFKQGGERSGVWEYVADITPESGPPFRTSLSQPRLMDHVVWLHEGDVVRAFADVKHQGAKFDRSDPRVSGEGHRAEGGETSKETFDQALAAPPGTPAAGEPGVRALGEHTAPELDRGVWEALIQDGEEAEENATDPKVAAEINALVDRFDSGGVTEEKYRAQLAELIGRTDPAS
jgi:hypothetical protein